MKQCHNFEWRVSSFYVADLRPIHILSGFNWTEGKFFLFSYSVLETWIQLSCCLSYSSHFESEPVEPKPPQVTSFPPDIRSMCSLLSSIMSLGGEQLDDCSVVASKGMRKKPAKIWFTEFLSPPPTKMKSSPMSKYKKENESSIQLFQFNYSQLILSPLFSVYFLLGVTLGSQNFASPWAKVLSRARVLALIYSSASRCLTSVLIQELVSPSWHQQWLFYV